MDYTSATIKIYPDIESINSACFEFSEEEARAKKLWRDDRPMPTIEELQIVMQEMEAKELVEAPERKKKMELAELNNELLEALAEKAEGKNEKWNTVKAKRDAIKLKYPEEK